MVTKRKRFSAEEIIGKLREAEVGLAQGQPMGQVVRKLGVSEQTYYRWRREYGGMKVDQGGQRCIRAGVHARVPRGVGRR